jgi:hypothetical protein
MTLTNYKPSANISTRLLFYSFANYIQHILMRCYENQSILPAFSINHVPQSKLRVTMFCQATQMATKEDNLLLK